jgi:plastocyanin
MVHLTSIFISATLLSGFVSALPTSGETTNDYNNNGYGYGGDQTTTTSSDTTTSTSAAGNYNNYNYGYGGDQTTTTTSDTTTSTSAAGNYGYGYGGDQTTSAEKSEDTSTSTEESTSTAMTYGSGKSNWGSYDDCVQKCVATYGAPPATYQPTQTSGSEGSTGTGSTVTVVVAPTSGVLRYVPAAVNATVGTTIKFMWGAGPHTVTKSSSLLPCNKSSEAPVFASGQQDKDFVFTQVVNDTKPAFYMCGVPGHCQKGMFGMINPANSFGAPSSVSAMAPALMANNPDLTAYNAYTRNNTEGKAGANWGSSIDLAGVPDWAQPLVYENVMFTRNLLAMNPDIVKEDGSIDLSSMDKTPIMIPQDVGAQLNAAGNGSGSGNDNGNTGATGTSQTSAAAAATTQPTSNSASIKASPKILVAVIAVVATFFAL